MLPDAAFSLRQGQLVPQTPETGPLGWTSFAVSVCPFTVLP